MKWFYRNKPLYPVYYTNPLRFFSIFVLIAFCWISIEPWNYAIAGEAKKRSPKTVSQSTKNSPAKSFEATLKRVQKLINDLDKGLNSGKDITLDLETLSGQEGNLEALNKAILAEFAQTKAFITEKNLAPVIHDRHKKAVGDYKKNFNELKKLLQVINKLGKAKDRDLPKAIKKAKDFLDKNVKKPRHQPLDPNNLPHRTAKPTKKKPRMTREAFLRDFGMEEAGKVVPVSYDGSGGVSGIPGATFASHPPNDDLPTAADLAETIEVQFTDEINALALELENNPVKIYNWVRNNIDFVPTYGSIQGANHCLLTKQCNDMDTASLLIALLRTSGIPARYVMGTIELPIDQVMNWVGGFTDPQAAVNFIASGGTPVLAGGIGGETAFAFKEHTWVEVYVDYMPSRGKISNLRETWVPLDGVFKQFSFDDGVDLTTELSFDAGAFMEQLQSSATINEEQGYVVNVDSNEIETTLSELQTQLINHLSTNHPGATVEDLIGQKTINLQVAEFLPGTLPYKTIIIGSKLSSLTDNLRSKITLNVSSKEYFESDLSFEASLPDLVGRRVTLSYTPASPEDQQAVESYGGLYEAPAYLFSVIPQVKVEGVVKAVGSPVGMGKTQDFSIIISLPEGKDNRARNDITSGGYYAVGLVSGLIPNDYIDHLKKRALQAEAFLENGGNHFSDRGLGEQLYLSVMSYFWELDLQGRATATSAGVIVARQPGEGTFSLSLSVNTIFDVPDAVEVTGVTIDIDHVVDIPGSKAGKFSDVLKYMNLTGVGASALEHGIIEQIYGVEAVSSVKAIQFANQEGMRTYKITPENISTVLPVLQTSSDVKGDILNAVNSGRVVIIPESNLEINDWHGIGYIILDQSSGAGAYLISGGFSGGSETENQGLDDIALKAFHLYDTLKKVAVVGAFASTLFYFFSTILPAFYAASFAGLIPFFPALFIFVVLMAMMTLLIFGLFLSVQTLIETSMLESGREYAFRNNRDIYSVSFHDIYFSRGLVFESHFTKQEIQKL